MGIVCEIQGHDLGHLAQLCSEQLDSYFYEPAKKPHHSPWIKLIWKKNILSLDEKHFVLLPQIMVD